MLLPSKHLGEVSSQGLLEAFKLLLGGGGPAEAMPCSALHKQEGRSFSLMIWQ